MRAMKRLTRLDLWDALILACFLAFVAGIIFGMTGCAVGRTLDADAPMVGLRLGDGDADALREGAASVGGLIGGFFGPGGAAAGATAGTVIGGIGAALLGWRSKRKEDAAFDEGVARGAGVPVPAVTRVAPVAPAEVKA